MVSANSAPLHWHWPLHKLAQWFFAAFSSIRDGRAAKKTVEQLMADHIKGDRSAFDRLFDQLSPPLLRYLQRHIFVADEAQDVLQDVFLQLHRARNDYDPNRPLKPWLFTIATNLMREHFRRIGRRLERPALLEDGVATAVDDVDPLRATQAQQVREALARLPWDQQEAISLHWLEGFTFQEIGNMVGASAGAVKVRAHRGYKVLASVLA